MLVYLLVKTCYMFDFKAFLMLNKLKQKEAAQYFGVSREMIAQISSGRSRCPKAWRDKILEDGAYQLPDEGDPAKVAEISPYEVELNDTNSLKYYYEMEATASNLTLFDDRVNTWPFRRLNIPAFAGCLGLNVTGDSMLPTAKNGDIVAVSPTPVTTIANGEIYLITTTDGQRMIKRLVRCKTETGEDAVRCVSDNADKGLYEDFILEGSRVLSVHRVRGFISCAVLA